MLNLQLKSGVNEKEREIILNGFQAYNERKVPFTQEKGVIPVNLTYRDEHETIVAAILSRIYYNVLDISVLWVHADYRGRSLGRQLLEKAEALAKERNCTWLISIPLIFRLRSFIKNWDILYLAN